MPEAKETILHPTPSTDTHVVSPPGVRSVEPSSSNRLVIGFDNDERRIFDVTPLLTIGRFQALASPEEFRKVRVVFDTVEWENGLDLDPEYLYQRSMPLETGQGAPPV